MPLILYAVWLLVGFTSRSAPPMRTQAGDLSPFAMAKAERLVRERCGLAFAPTDSAGHTMLRYIEQTLSGKTN